MPTELGCVLRTSDFFSFQSFSLQDTPNPLYFLCLLYVIELFFFLFETGDAFIGAEPDVAGMVFDYGSDVGVVKSFGALVFLIIQAFRRKTYQAVTCGYPYVTSGVFIYVVESVYQF